MDFLQRHVGWGWLFLGILLGAGLFAFRSETPMHASATDRVESFAMATGEMEIGGVEAVYYLDALTGSLTAGVLSNQTEGFQSRYTANVYGDLMGVINRFNTMRQAGGGTMPQIQIPAKPQYMIVTGRNDIRRGAGLGARPSGCCVYVAETNTGIVMVYLIPWDPQSHVNNNPVDVPMVLRAAEQFSTAVVRNAS